MTDNKKATLENNKAKVEKSKSDLKDYSNKPPSDHVVDKQYKTCLLYTSPSPRDRVRSRMPSSA